MNISAQDYYTQLGLLRDKYFNEGTQDCELKTKMLDTIEDFMKYDENGNSKLKDKLTITASLIDREIRQYQEHSAGTDSAAKKEAVDALVALGYGYTESVKAVNQVDGAESMDVGALLKAALMKIF